MTLIAKGEHPVWTGGFVGACVCGHHKHSHVAQGCTVSSYASDGYRYPCWCPRFRLQEETP